jgi:GT2 family glycosyltransferase
MSRISVLISTHNPNFALFERTLSAIAAQTLAAQHWELVIVDNASVKPLKIDEVPWKRQNCRLIREERLGLSYGRLAAIRQSESALVVFVDDDSVLAPDYLETAIRIFSSEEGLGLAGGIIEPEWCDQEPEAWAFEFLWGLALRNFGNSAIIGSMGSESTDFPHCAPIGAGMIARRAALKDWMMQPEASLLSDRRGSELSSCGDTEIVLNALRSGWSVGYFPELKLTHLIPGRRLHADYLARLLYEVQKSWVQVLHKHGMSPKPAAPVTVPLRKLRAYLRCRAWAGPAEYIRWRTACGYFDGRAAIYRRQNAL